VSRDRVAVGQGNGVGRETARVSHTRAVKGLRVADFQLAEEQVAAVVAGEEELLVIRCLTHRW
jgi:hypothetical protein